MTPTGVRELPFYVDNLDLVGDWLSGAIKHNEEIVYRDTICEVIGDFVDEDGNKYTELLAVDGAGVSFVPMQ